VARRVANAAALRQGTRFAEVVRVLTRACLLQVFMCHELLLREDPTRPHRDPLGNGSAYGVATLSAPAGAGAGAALQQHARKPGFDGRCV
jgi:hypothetical protein